jgi:hypothetical protein
VVRVAVTIHALAERGNGDRMNANEACLVSALRSFTTRGAALHLTRERNRPKHRSGASINLAIPRTDDRREGATMFFRAFVAMVTADAVDRRMREQQYRGWVAAEEARAAAANSPRRPLFAPPSGSWGYDPLRPERPS